MGPKKKYKNKKAEEFRGAITKECIQGHFGILETSIESGLKKFSDTAPVSGAKDGGIAFALKPHFATISSFPVQHSCPEAAHLTVTLTLTYNKQVTNFFCIYRPLPSKQNKFSPSMFFDQFSYFLEHCDTLPAKTRRMGDFKFHFENVAKNTPSRTLRSSSDTRMLKIQQ